MKTYAFDFKGHSPNRIAAFSTRKEASCAGNGFVIASSAEELAETLNSEAKVTLNQMVELYNSAAATKIKEFRDRATAIKRIFALAEASAKLQTVEQKKEVQMTVATETNTAKAPKVASGRKGRNSAFEGKAIHLAEGVKANPRRENTHGHRSMEIIIGNPGITYEQFIAAGGRRVDLAWDIAHGNVKLG